MWPKGDGFKGGNIPKETQTLKKGFCFKRYGDETGEFLGNTTDPFELRSLAPYTDETNVHYYRLKQDCDEFTVGEAAPWFDQPGGAKQYVIYKRDGDGNIKIDDDGEYMRKSIHDLLEGENSILEDITEKPLKGEIKFE